ncbi:hypothetical protein C4F50_15435 [Flavobacterium sp. KB82]|uniref:Uncharacterized protein n=1 Tax=Flavobacterium hungaricum TaxID=2082725 RepID=A0ABR9TLT7_9FLAO|nr:hypothetical protein [Flavobacterium hungaricum]
MPELCGGIKLKRLLHSGGPAGKRAAVKTEKSFLESTAVLLKRKNSAALRSLSIYCTNRL